jgi:hypothetical protein
MLVENQCDFDGSCPDDQKCCLDPYKRTCMEPCISDISQCKCVVGIPTIINDTGDSNCGRCSCENPCLVYKNNF